jgi:hypothetical protein
MNIRRVIPIALALGAAASTSTAAVINFDGLAGGPVFGGELVTSQYSGLGVTFSDTYGGGAHANNTLTGFIAGSSAPNVLWVDQGSGSYTGHYLEIDFSIPVQNVSTVFGTSVSADITLAAYNGASLLGSVNTVGGNNSGSVLSGVVGFDTAQNITSVHLFSHSLGTGASFNFDIDNFTINAVPEPGVMALFGLSLTCLGAWKHSRRARLLQAG